MKLLIFCPYYPPHIGGLESHADEFNKHLSQKGADITVFTPKLPQDAPMDEIRHSGVKIIRFPAFEIIPNYPLPKFWRMNFWRLFIGLYKIDPDIVISRTRFFSTSLLAFFYAKTRRKRWVHIEHGSDFVKLNSPLSSAIARSYDLTFGRLVLRFSDQNIANSQASADFVQKLSGNKKPCGIVYRGVETREIENIVPDRDLAEKYGSHTIIAYLGRLIDGKGVADLIKAIAPIKESGIRCFIIGDGPQKKNLEKLSEDLDMTDKIIFFGHKRFKEAIAILKTADIVVNTSYTEGLPTSVIEAALCKKAIIATDVGGTREIITDEKSGFLIRPKNPEMISRKIATLMQNPLQKASFGNSAYEQVNHKFDWERSIEKYLALFEDMLRQ